MECGDTNPSRSNSVSTKLFSNENIPESIQESGCGEKLLEQPTDDRSAHDPCVDSRSLRSRSATQPLSFSQDEWTFYVPITPQMLVMTLKNLKRQKRRPDLYSIAKYILLHFPVQKCRRLMKRELRRKLDCAVNTDILLKKGHFYSINLGSVTVRQRYINSFWSSVGDDEGISANNSPLTSIARSQEIRGRRATSSTCTIKSSEKSCQTKISMSSKVNGNSRLIKNKKVNSLHTKQKTDYNKKTKISNTKQVKLNKTGKLVRRSKKSPEPSRKKRSKYNLRSPKPRNESYTKGNPFTNAYGLSSGTGASKCLQRLVEVSKRPEGMFPQRKGRGRPRNGAVVLTWKLKKGKKRDNAPALVGGSRQRLLNAKKMLYNHFVHRSTRKPGYFKYLWDDQLKAYIRVFEENQKHLRGRRAGPPLYHLAC